MNTCLKYFFVIFNLFFVIVGFLSIGFVLWIEYIPLINEVVKTAALDIIIFYFGITLGIVLTVVGGVGALGACYEKKWMLKIYLIIVFVFIIGEVAAIVYGFLGGKDEFVKGLAKAWDLFQNDTKFLIQTNFNCCGYTNASEWNNNLPASCFNTSSVNETVMWEDTCSDSVLTWFRNNILVFAIAVLVTALIQVFQLIATIMLIRAKPVEPQEQRNVNPENNYKSPQNRGKQGQANQVFELEDINDTFNDDYYPRTKNMNKRQPQQPQTSTSW